MVKKEKKTYSTDSKEEKAEIDKERPHFTIGYKKGDKDAIVVENSGKADEVEVAVMLTHAQAVNTLGYFNRVRRVQEEMAKQARLNNKKQEFKSQRTSKKKSSKNDK